MKNVIFYLLIFAFIIAGIIIMFNNGSTENTAVRDEDWKNVCSVQNPGDAYFDEYIPADFYDKIAAGGFSKELYPKFSDRKAWAKAAESKYAAMIIAKADAIPAKVVPRMLFSHYRRYAIDGNRAEFQRLYFRKRRDTGYLALALCISGDKEKYMPRLLDHVVSLMEDFSWTLHAHMLWDSKLLRNASRTDLFCAETGAMMALIYHVLGEELDKEIENFSEMIRRQTLGRTVYNLMYNPDSAALHWWYVSANPNNWLPWCSYNLLVTAVLMEKDNERLAFYIRQLLRSNARFAASYGDDGFCDEGANYCNEAGMMLFNILHLMHKMRPGSMDKLFAQPKIRAMFEFMAKVRIGKDHQVSFGDARPGYSPRIDRAAICGALIKSELMADVGKMKTAALGSNGDHLETGLKLLFDMPEMKNAEIPKAEQFTYFRDRLGIIRSDKFSAAMKAGHNAESHNHNDLGHFTLYYDGEPLIVDAGTETYKKINFSDKRYTLWYTRGAGHNAPVFGKFEQMYGMEYAAKFLKADKKGFLCDLSKAYPAEAGVKSFTRKLDFKPDEVVIEDKFELAKPLDAVITLLSPAKAEKLNGKLRLGNVIIETDGIEFFEQQQMPELFYGRSIWGKPLNAIRFKSNKNNYRFIFKGADK